MNKAQLKGFLGDYILKGDEFITLLKIINTKKEIWVDIKGYEREYKISSFGTVKSLKRFCKHSQNVLRIVPERILKVDKTGDYCTVSLRSKEKHFLHRLMAISFIPNPENKPQVNHKDGNKFNNKLSNLEWNTRSENQFHANRVLKISHAFHSRPVIQYSLAGGRIKRYKSQWEAHRQTGISQGNIGMCVRGERKIAGGYYWK